VHEHHRCFISQFCDLANMVTSIGWFFLILRTSGPNFDIKNFFGRFSGWSLVLQISNFCSSNYLSTIQKSSNCLFKEPNSLSKIFVKGFGFELDSSKRVVSWSCLVSVSPEMYGFRLCSHQNWTWNPLVEHFKLGSLPTLGQKSVTKFNQYWLNIIYGKKKGSFYILGYLLRNVIKI
jgi:hypothetical protein